MRGARILLPLLLIACNSKPKAPVFDPPGTCLAVPAAVRYHLYGDPNGGGLFYLEAVHQFDYLNAWRSFTNFVRYDLRDRRAEVLVDHAMSPVVFVRGEPVMRRQFGEKHEVVRVSRDKQVQAVTPDYLDVWDLISVDDHTVAMLADGDGNRAVYVLDFDHPRPRYVADAETLLSAEPGKVFIVAGDEAVAIDLKTGARTRIYRDEGAVNVGSLAHVAQDDVVRVHDLASGEDKTVIPTKAVWKLVDQGDSVLARTAPANDRSLAYLIANGKATQLPDITGGTSIMRTTTVAGKTWALIGHNTTNSIDDLADTVAETDICTLPARGKVNFASRAVPGRYLSKQNKLFTALEQVAPGAGVQLAEDYTYPIAVSVTLKNERAGMDFSKMRDRVREVHEKATHQLDDRQVRTELNFSDMRTAIRSWRRDRMRERTFVGMGSALVSDPVDVDLEVRDLVNEVNRDGKIVCSGTITNMQTKALENFELRCSTDRTIAIKIPMLEGNASTKFNQTFENPDENTAFFEAIKDGEPLELLDMAHEAQ
ncbi:MAG TPA: hypothetical protein VLB44_21395, partial [Kofleriaceae bacterium]|nr:hypothetical protein [Kofleriaceae bacterium]